jgi:hypothetical protein
MPSSVEASRVQNAWTIVSTEWKMNDEAMSTQATP